MAASTETTFREVDRGGLRLLLWTGSALAGRVVAAFSTRQGGVSQGPYATLNLSAGVGDDPAAVAENRARLLAALGVEKDTVFCARQVHGTAILPARAATAEPAGHTARGQILWRVGSGDGLWTDRPGQVLLTFHADCVPIYLVDVEAGVAVLVHAGWRGTLAGAATQGVKTAAQAGAQPDRLWAAIGPAIGPCCYEVDQPVLERVYQRFGAGASALLRPAREGRARLDLWEANRRLLVAAGVPPNRIALAGLCTHCRDDLFFSHRRSGGRPAGRMAAVLALVDG
ncbi:MAG TPA: peptidoglycan editing factor PgeF [Bacillota bacterium]